MKRPAVDWPLVIPEAVHEEMIAHCRLEAPLECCGLLAGFPPFVSAIYPLRNELASETRYNADPLELLAAHQALRARKFDLLAIYHSHPRWAPIPSQADLDLNHCGPVPRIIVSLLGKEPEVRIWRLDEKTYQELPWRITPRSC